MKTLAILLAKKVPLVILASKVLPILLAKKMQALLSSLPSLHSLLHSLKVAYVNLLSIHGNLRHPFFVSTGLGALITNTRSAGSVVLAYTKILLILAARRLSQVCNCIVSSIPVNVVKLVFGKYAKNIKPCKSVGKVKSITAPDVRVSMEAQGTGNLPGFSPSTDILLPSKDPSIWVVVKQFAQALCGKIVLSHAVSPVKKWFGQRPGRVTSTSRLRYFSVGLLPIAMLSACSSTNDYKAYAEAHSNVAAARANAETARYNALSKIAENGTDSARVAAVVALALSNQGSAQTQPIAAPPQDSALAWAQVLVPSVTNIAGLHYASRASIASAESAATVAKSTNEAFVGIAGKIQAPITVVPQTIAPVLPQANVSTVTTTTNNANQANVTTTSSANQANTTTSTANPTTVTLSGTGVVGSGTATTSANPVTTTTTTNPSTVIPAGAVCAVSAAGTLDCKP